MRLNLLIYFHTKTVRFQLSLSKILRSVCSLNAWIYRASFENCFWCHKNLFKLLILLMQSILAKILMVAFFMIPRITSFMMVHLLMLLIFKLYFQFQLPSFFFYFLLYALDLQRWRMRLFKLTNRFTKFWMRQIEVRTRWSIDVFNLLIKLAWQRWI